jgi:hypothetical protein
MKTDPIIERYQAFWESSSQDADFESQSKILRSLITYIKGEYDDVSDYVELLLDLISELDKYLPLMDLDQFCAASKAISYGKRSIRVSGNPTFASGLSRDITEEERKQLRESINASDRDRAQGANGAGNDAGNDFSDLLDDNDGD